MERIEIVQLKSGIYLYEVMTNPDHGIYYNHLQKAKIKQGSYIWVFNGVRASAVEKTYIIDSNVVGWSYCLLKWLKQNTRMVNPIQQCKLHTINRLKISHAAAGSAILQLKK